MQLSLEIPIPEISVFLPLMDFPFGLAQLFLREGYEEYKQTHQGCLLDNGMYELGEPLATWQLLEAAWKATPTAVIAPDWMDDMDRTLEAVEELTAARKSQRWSIGGVVQGRDLNERLACYLALVQAKCRPICFPFRTPRGDTIKRIHQTCGFDEVGWYHLLGLQDINELAWRFRGSWSVDTGKPFKGYKLTDKVIRGHGRLDIHKELPVTDTVLALWNIAYMRKVMRD